MRHVPISLYIDTEVYVRNGLRFDRNALSRLTGDFVKGGLRLLVPAVMERELLRHFRRQAKTAADKVIQSHKAYPLSDLSIAELPSQSELQQECLDYMTRQWSTFKEHFVLENLPAVGNLEEVLDWYFDVRPPFSSKKEKEFPDAFIISALDQYHGQSHRNIAVIGFDGDFAKACVEQTVHILFL